MSKKNSEVGEKMSRARRISNMEQPYPYVAPRTRSRQEQQQDLVVAGFVNDIVSIAESGGGRQNDIKEVIDQSRAFIKTGVDNHYEAAQPLFSPINDTLRQAFSYAMKNNVNFQTAVGVVDSPFFSDPAAAAAPAPGNQTEDEGVVPIKPIMHLLVNSEIQNTLRIITHDEEQHLFNNRKDILRRYIQSMVETPSLFCRVTTCREGIRGNKLRSTLAGDTEAQLAATNVTDKGKGNSHSNAIQRAKHPNDGQLRTATIPQVHNKKYATTNHDERSRCCICGYPLYGSIQIEHIVSCQTMALTGVSPKLHLQKNKGGTGHWLQRVCDNLLPLNNSYANTVRSMMLPSHDTCNGKSFKSEHSPFIIDDDGLIGMTEASWNAYVEVVINPAINHQQRQFDSKTPKTPKLTLSSNRETHRRRWLEIQRNQFEDIVNFLRSAMSSDKQNCFSMIKKMRPSQESDKSGYIDFLCEILGIEPSKFSADRSLSNDDIIDYLLSDQNKEVITDFMYITILKVYLRLAHAASTIGTQDKTGSTAFIPPTPGSTDSSESGAGTDVGSGTAAVVAGIAGSPPRNISTKNKAQVSALKSPLDTILSQSTNFSALTPPQSQSQSQQGAVSQLGEQATRRNLLFPPLSKEDLDALFNNTPGGRKTKKRIRKTKKKKMNKKSKTRRRRK
jgi:hypothetical protein